MDNNTIQTLKSVMNEVLDEKLSGFKTELVDTMDKKLESLENRMDEKLEKLENKMVNTMDEKLRDSENLLLEEMDICMVCIFNGKQRHITACLFKLIMKFFSLSKRHSMIIISMNN